MAADNDRREGRQFSDEELQDLVASADSGARNPKKRNIALLIAGLALAWSLFQLWIAQPMLWFGEWFSVIELLADAALSTCSSPSCWPSSPIRRSKARPVTASPSPNWILLAVGGFCAFYVFWFTDTLAMTARSGLPTQFQVIVGAVGILVLLEASRRALGPALTIVGALFLLYAYMGQGWLIPDLIEHEGLSFRALINAQWLDTGGVFGIPLGVSTAFVFLFVLFGSLLDKAGAGNYFIKLAFAGLGHLRGGPAKAAVVGSAMTGLISGSSIANVVTTGTFTIPLMKRVGFTNEQAGSGRSRVLGQRPDHASRHGRGGLPDGGVHRDLLRRGHQARLHPGGDLLHCAGLHRASGGPEKGHARVGRGQVLRRDDREILPGLRRGGRGLHRADLRRGRAGGDRARPERARS